MRISFRHQYDTYQSDLSRTQSAYLEAQQRVSTGKRIGRPSDDAGGTFFSVKARALSSALDQYSKNLSTAETTLKTTEASLDEVGKLIRRSREVAIQGSTDTIDQNARNALADEVGRLQTKLVEMGNTQVADGSYVFAGQRIDTKPFEIDNGTLIYRGDQADVTVEISPSDTMKASGSGEVLIGDTWARLESLRQNLLAGNLADISNTDIAGIDQVEANVGTERGKIGARLQTVEEYQAHHERRIDDLTGQISNIEDVDISEAIIQLTQAETAYQAALQTVSMTSGLSLLNFLR